MIHGLTRGLAAALLAAGLATGGAVAQEAPKSIRIGYAISLTGPFAPGATATTLPNYQLWASEVNATGGIMLKKYGKKVPVEIVEYDDGSTAENAVRLYERLILSDKVDFVLPPWGTGLNLAVAPVLNKHGFPHLAVTAVNSSQDQLSQRWNNLFWFLGKPEDGVDALLAALKGLKADGRINAKVAVMNVADQFGAELVGAAVPALKKAGFDVVYNKSYPPSVKDLAPQIKEIQHLEPDTFLAFSYPGDTMMITGQAQTLGFSPKVYFNAVGSQFPFYKGKFGASAEGVMGLGGWDPATPAAQTYLKRHVEVTGKEPDRWASPVTYASLQVLQQAIEQVGEIDRAKVIAAVAKSEFQTVVGGFRMENHRRPRQWWLGQWQGGEFVAIEPANLPGAGKIMFPKPKW